MNWITAVVLFTVLALFGIPKVLPNQFSLPQDTQVSAETLHIGFIEKNSAAQKAGLKIGDKILALDGRVVATASELTKTTKQLKGKQVEITYSRAGKEKTTTASLRSSNDDNKGYLGVAPRESSELRSTWSAPIVGVGLTVQLTTETFKELGKLLGDLGYGLATKLSSDEATQKDGEAAIENASSRVAGPVGILGVIFPQMQQAGIKPLVLLTAVISLSLAVMNVLPIPALDGGRWFTMTIFRLIKKPLTKEREEKIQTIGFLVLIGLVILVTFADVSKILG